MWFLARNESVLSYSVHGETTQKGIIDYSAEEGLRIETDSFCIENIQNKYDDNAIVVINAPGVYGNEYCLRCGIGEFSNLVLYEKGEYQVKIVDSVGHTIAFDVSLSGKGRISDFERQGKMTYMDLYNNLYWAK